MGTLRLGTPLGVLRSVREGGGGEESVLSAPNVGDDCDEDDGGDGDGGDDVDGGDGVGDDKGPWKRCQRMEGWWQVGACLGHPQPSAGHRR